MHAQLIVNVLSKRSKAPLPPANNCLIGAFRLPNCRAANGRPNYCAIVRAAVHFHYCQQHILFTQGDMLPTNDFIFLGRIKEVISRWHVWGESGHYHTH